MDDRITKAVDEAEMAFWQKIGEHFPEAETGDLDPLTCHRLSMEMTETVKEWVANNVPQGETDEAPVPG